MKIFSYTASTIEEVPEKREWIENLGLRIIKEQHIEDSKHVIIVFLIPDEETEIMLKLKYGMYTFVDRST